MEKEKEKQHRVFHLRAVKSDQEIISDEFETSHNGPGTVSSGKLSDGRADSGGPSYGTYQFTSQDVDKDGHVVHNGGTVGRFLHSADGAPWRDQFKDAHGHELKAGTPEFTKQWKSIAEKDGESFASAQQTFTGKTYYNPQEDRLARAGVDLENRSVTVQNVVWSTSVQHGANSPLMRDAVQEKAEHLHKPAAQLTDRECIDSIYDRRKSDNPRDGVRYERERTFAQNMLRHENEQAAQTPQGGVHQSDHGLAPVPPQLSPGMSRQMGAEAQPLTGNAMPGLAPVPLDAVQALVQQAAPAKGSQDRAQDKPSEQQDRPGEKKDKAKQKQDSLSSFNPLVTPRGGL